jgi:hypothetical protein
MFPACTGRRRSRPQTYHNIGTWEMSDCSADYLVVDHTKCDYTVVDSRKCLVIAALNIVSQHVPSVIISNLKSDEGGLLDRQIQLRNQIVESGIHLILSPQVATSDSDEEQSKAKFRHHLENQYIKDPCHFDNTVFTHLNSYLETFSFHTLASPLTVSFFSLLLQYSLFMIKVFFFFFFFLCI